MVNCLLSDRLMMMRWAVAVLLWAAVCSARADYVVQVGVFEKPRYAGDIARTLHLGGLTVKAQPIIDVPGGLIIRLMVGPYATRREAEDALVRVKALGQEGFIRKYVEGPEVKRPSPRPGPAPVPKETTTVPPPPAPAKEPLIVLDRLNIEPPPPSELTEEQIQELLALAPPEIPVPAEDLFGLGELPTAPPSRITGFFQSELAYAWREPAHLSKFRHTLELSTQGEWGGWAKWKLSGRAAYDAVFDVDDYYPAAVDDDQSLQASVRETYLDFSLGAWDFRLGRQHIIWGEMVGLFFADVVSAKDLREFVLPEFEMLRIPQWALRSEYFSGDFHGEAVWIPYPSYDDIGVPGAEFYPYPAPPAGYGLAFRDEEKPAGELRHSGYGLRLSYIQSGWDLSGFYYSSMDASAAFFRDVIATPVPTVIYRPTHERIQQYGATLSKDFLSMVFKAEVIYTQDRWFEVTRLRDVDGAVQQDALDYVVGLEYPLPARSRLNLQFFQRWYPDHDPDMTAKAVESGASVYLSTHWRSLEPQLLLVGSSNRGDWLARPKIVWELGRQWRWVNGVDVFGGNRSGLFGRYGNLDRVYSELRYTF